MVNLKKYFWKFSSQSNRKEKYWKKKQKPQKYHRDIRSISSSPIIGLPEWEDKNEQPIFKDIISNFPHVCWNNP